ncbi:MAG: Sec-independent protein translocase subunit TatB [Propionibacterium sp.]|nr:Sec-independent protein translocase subunit TatB [Propionibacterium sp.]
MFNIDASELILLLILGVVMFGPEKLPMFARKAARVFVAVRNIANNAQTQLREELGPEYSDLKLEDLNPKKFVAKHMREEIAAIEEAKREISTVSSTVKAAAEMTASTAVTNDSMIETDAATLALLAAPYDPEAT